MWTLTGTGWRTSVVPCLRRQKQRDRKCPLSSHLTCSTVEASQCLLSVGYVIRAQVALTCLHIDIDVFCVPLPAAEMYACSTQTSSLKEKWKSCMGFKMSHLFYGFTPFVCWTLTLVSVKLPLLLAKGVRFLKCILEGMHKQLIFFPSFFSY